MKINIWHGPRSGVWHWELLDGEPYCHDNGVRASCVAQSLYRQVRARGQAASHPEALEAATRVLTDLS